jgi:hypothetical protein
MLCAVFFSIFLLLFNIIICNSSTCLRGKITPFVFFFRLRELPANLWVQSAQGKKEKYTFLCQQQKEKKRERKRADFQLSLVK